ncbi:MAG: metalloregulator ArsR/SmtB family transcription factor [bacterium]
MNALDALGNPVRRQILLELRAKPLSVGELAGRFPVSRPAISKHLRALERGGLVETSRKGTRHLYSVRVQGFASVREFIDGFWDTALDRLASMARDETSMTRRRRS